MENQNIAQVLPEVAARWPERPGLVVRKATGYCSWSFREMDSASNALAHRLVAQGIGPADRVLLMVRPSLEFIALTFALFKIGALVILIDPGMGFRNLGRCIAGVAPTVFVGIPKAHLLRVLSPNAFRTVRHFVWVSNLFGLSARTLAGPDSPAAESFPVYPRGLDDPAAILFTTGSTGPPKGVCYTHGIFRAQLALVRDHYGITPDDIDQPAFPLFALFSTALGACAVIPDMDPSRPARVDPARFIKTILDQQVTYSFGSPAIWNVVSRYCLAKGIRLPSLRKVLMAGAPVPGELIQRVRAIMTPDGEVHTPYGATESLPIASMTGSEIVAATWPLTKTGAGTCVGRPLPGITIRVVPITSGPIAVWDEALALPVGEIGEIVVRGPVVTKAYENNDRENAFAKIDDNAGFWHRLGDVGYFDEQGRLWFCGRKAHIVSTAAGAMYTIRCEAIFNEHPAVFRSALVGVGPAGRQLPVLVVELRYKVADPAALAAELKTLAVANPLTRSIEHFLIHPAFPVDIRHNAKIFREKIAVWAVGRLRGIGI